MRAYIKNSERSQINDLMLHLKLLKHKQAKPKRSRRRERIIIETKKKKSIERIKKTKSLFFEKPNKINKPLANLTKMRKEKTKINKTRNEKGEIRKHTKKSREYFVKLYSNKMEN
jgi:hypothetical protein